MSRFVAFVITLGVALLLGQAVERSWGVGLQAAGLAGAAVLLAGGWAIAGIVYLGFGRQPSAGFLAAVVVVVSLINAVAIMVVRSQ